MRQKRATLFKTVSQRAQKFGEDATREEKICDIEVNFSCRSANSYNLNQTNAVKYDFLAVTRSCRAECGMLLEIDGTKYKISFVIPSGRLNQLFLEGMENGT